MIRLFNHYLSVRTLLLAAIEAVVLFQSVVLGFQIRMADFSLRLPVAEAGVFAFIMMVMMTSLGLYQAQAEPFRATIQRVLVAYGLSLIGMSFFFYLFQGFYVGRGVFAVSSVFAMAGVLLVRLIFFRMTDIGLPRRRVLVLGNGPEAEEIIRYLHNSEQVRAIQYAGMYPVVSEREAGEPERRINHDQLLRTVRDLKVSEIVIAVRERRGGVLPLRQLLDARLAGVRVMDLAAFYERERGMLKVDNLRASWLIFGQGFDQGMTRDVVKRLFDVFVSLILLFLTLPLVLGAVIMIVLESGWPVLYRQERVGQGGVPFTIFKLRSMRQDAEKDGRPQWAQAADARVTRVGRFIRKTRIDELPQLYNVLRGDMSFVGPRPERPFFVDQLIADIPYYDVRHSVKPGVTGWSQVRYPYGASVEDSLAKLQYDLYYVKNHSLFLDLLILMETAQVVLLGKGAR
ncbi:MAG TPA: TIGR03013 family PEP-CTERM/XrtA system glycosyltransferase [Burkholderiaceae bacterium]|nr:TIGR03013 family PEP-CTERM/XrtA system glycosyltransferase [Burkholderiaceae bacterium]